MIAFTCRAVCVCVAIVGPPFNVRQPSASCRISHARIDRRRGGCCPGSLAADQPFGLRARSRRSISSVRRSTFDRCRSRCDDPLLGGEEDEELFLGALHCALSGAVDSAAADRSLKAHPEVHTSRAAATVHIEEVGALVQASVHAITARARALIDTDTTTL